MKPRDSDVVQRIAGLDRKDLQLLLDFMRPVDTETDSAHASQDKQRRSALTDQTDDS